ncbi:DUF6328 family protein [Streptomyces sp. NBC_00388]|uniref:DUF6328 family protein n=1 Tax=Streptomyces sp. NBC_00388 TaxID=2975735 RepID=UPI003FA6F56D
MTHHVKRRGSHAPGPFQPRFADLSSADDRTICVVAATRAPATVAALIAFVSFRRLLNGRQLKFQASVWESRPAVLGPALLLRTMRSALPLVLPVALADTMALWLVGAIAHRRVVPCPLARVPGLRHGPYDGRTRQVRGSASRRSCKRARRIYHCAVHVIRRSWFKVPEKSQRHRHAPPHLAFMQVRRGVTVLLLRAFRCRGRSRSARPPS